MKWTVANGVGLALVAFALGTRGAEPRSPGPAALAAAAGAPGSSAGLAHQVWAIFAAKCLDCHAADLPKPKGKFGYVLDLGRMAANPKMVVAGNLDKSELYQMIINNEMPGKKSGLVLTAAEKETVERWIEAGAPTAPDLPLTVARVAPRVPLGRRVVRDLGNLHPLSTHFPVALLLAALPAEFMWWRTRKSAWKSIVRYCVTLGALGAVGAATLGWLNAEFVSYNGVSAGVLTWHRFVGTFTAVWAVGLAILAEFSDRRDHPVHLSRWFQALLGAGALLVGSAGFLGASLVYGLDHLKL